jgi:hypothetical protein
VPGSIKQTRPAGRVNQALHLGCRLDSEVKDTLSRILQQLTGALQQHAELGLGMCRADMLHDALTSAHILRDLYRRRAGGRPNPPDKHHIGDIRPHR